MLFHLVLLAIVASFALAQPVKFERRSDRQYPEPYSIPDSSLTPQAWTDALNAAIAAGKIPNIPVASNQNGNPVYSGVDGSGSFVCSWTISKCYAPDDVHDAINNTLGLTFDDGPTNASDELYYFLGNHSQSSTHFMIGSQILTQREQFKHALALGNQHIASHTFSHQPLSTTLTNEQLVAELGWTSQIIYDLSGFVPSFVRPPTGDVDNRVRAIAREVFGLTTVLWNQDTNDWCLQDDGTSACPGEDPGKDYASVANAAESFINMKDRSQGLIMLEHELTNQSVSVFSCTSVYVLTWRGVGDKTYTNPYTNVNGPLYVQGRNGSSSPHQTRLGSVLAAIYDISLHHSGYCRVPRVACALQIPVHQYTAIIWSDRHTASLMVSDVTQKNLWTVSNVHADLLQGDPTTGPVIIGCDEEAPGDISK